MTSFAFNLAKAGLLNSRDAHTVSDVEMDYRLRLFDRSYRLVELPLPDVQSDEERAEIIAEVLGILGFANKQIIRASRTRTYISAATAEIYRSVTMDWFLSIQPLLSMYLSQPQMKTINASAASLRSKKTTT